MTLASTAATTAMTSNEPRPEPPGTRWATADPRPCREIALTTSPSARTKARKGRSIEMASSWRVVRRRTTAGTASTRAPPRAANAGLTLKAEVAKEAGERHPNHRGHEDGNGEWGHLARVPTADEVTGEEAAEHQPLHADRRQPGERHGGAESSEGDATRTQP